MELMEAIKKSEFSVIESGSKAGKFTFSLAVLSKLEINNPLVISSISKPIIQKRLDNLKNIKNNNFQKLLEKISLFSLKNNWENLKSLYGFNFFIEDLTKLINDKSPDALVFLRPDLMFSEIEFDYAKTFIEELINQKNNLNFKLFITTGKDSLISEFSENYTDITFLIENYNSLRKIVVKNSIFPLKYYEYEFSLNNLVFDKIYEQNNKETKNNTNINNGVKLKPKMLVISENEYFFNLHKFLFEKYFDLSVAMSIGEVISKIMQNPDLIIYQTEKEEPDTTVCSLIKENKLNSKIIYFINKDFIRTEDKMKVTYLGCYEILPKIFNIEEYIFILEKAVDNYFYTKIIHKLPTFKYIKTVKKFEEIIENLYNEGIYFSILKLNEKIENIEDKLRMHDIIYKSENFECLVLMNITKRFFETKLKDKFNINDYEIIEAIDFDKNKDFCK
jgi:hypothetical protein